MSRRGLFGSGIAQVIGARFGDTAATGPAAAAGPRQALPTWEEADSGRLGARLGPVAEALAGLAARPGLRVIDVTAGDGAVALELARAGAEVLAVDARQDRVVRGRNRCAATGGITWEVAPVDDLPVRDASVDAVVSAFEATYGDDPRSTAAELRRVLRPGGRVALAAWSGVMGEVLRCAAAATGIRRGPRPDRWSRYETAYLHFFDYEDLDLIPHALEWRFDSLDAAADELAAPLAGDRSHDAVRTALLDLLGSRARPEAHGLVVEASFVIVSARKP